MPSQSRRLIEAFAQCHDPKYFAEDVVYTQMPMSQSFNGRDAIAAMLRLFYSDAFSDARGELRNVGIDAENDIGFIEFVFRGRHTGALMDIRATGRHVEIPMVGLYEIVDGKIQQARLYYDMATLLRQLDRSS